jgi:CPA2 family monovalent cation:H+ antiporter-2
MAGEIRIEPYSDALLVLGTAAVLVPLARRAGISPIFAYLGAGFALGPFGLGSFANDHPAIDWLTISDSQNVAGIAELGVVFLLFLIGLELSPTRLYAMRRQVIGLGFGQVLITSAALAGGFWFLGYDAAAAIIVGICLALSSTAIVIEIYSMQGRFMTTAGRASFSILLAQDIAVIPMLILVSLLAAGKSASVMEGLMLAIGQAFLALAAIAVLGRALLKRFFSMIARTQSAEMFIAATLLVIVASGVAAAAAGLSMALGAFVAGLILSETEFRKAVQAIVEPFKSLLLGLFFFSVGMSADMSLFTSDPLRLAAAVVALLCVKAAILFAMTRLFGIARMPALETAMMLAAGGEFAFVGISAAVNAGIISPEAARFPFALTTLTMALIPLLAILARRIEAWAAPDTVHDPALDLQPSEMRNHAIVVGHGRVGKVVCEMLERNSVAFVATDMDPAVVSRERKAGREVFFGNAADPLFLGISGIAHARAVIVTIHTAGAITEIIQVIRSLRPDIEVLCRARDASHARQLYAAGANDVVPETTEASLLLAEASLLSLGLPTGKIIASIHERRDEFRQEFREAARINQRAAQAGEN